MSIKSAVLGLIALLAVATSTNVVMAAGDDLGTADVGAIAYLSDDYVLQGKYAPTNKVKNFSMYSWFGGSTLRYSADPVIQSDVQLVVSGFNAFFPNLRLIEDPGDPLVTYDTNIAPCGAGAVGCIIFLNFVGSVAGAWWPTRAAIHISPNLDAASRRYAIAHETGHLYGLDEGYLIANGVVVCNTTDSASLMDALGCEGQIWTPQPIDVQRINDYWSIKLTDILGVDGNTPQTEHVWKDNSYVDWALWYSAEYWNGSGFVPYEQPGWIVNDDIGFKWQLWRLNLGLIVTSPQARGAPPGLQRLCVITWQWANGGQMSGATCKEYYTFY